MLLENKEVIRFEEYEIDRQRWTVRWRQESIALRRKSLDVLLYLIDHRDRVVSKEELLDTLWAGQFVEEGNLTQQIFLLRKALSRHETGTPVIETVAGRGYRFVATVVAGVEEQAQISTEFITKSSKTVTEIIIEEQEVDTTEPVVSGSAFAQPLELPNPRNPHPYRIVLGLIAAVVLCAAGWFAWQRWLDRTGGPPIDVVLTPIEGSTGDSVLDRALVDALRMDLAQSPFVSVVSPARLRTTLTEMKQKPDGPMTLSVAREVCERTNSQAVLHGSVARVGQHFLLTEEATSCVDGTELAEAAHEASGTEDLPNSIDKLAESLRQKLGESRRSIARFDVPLFQANTASLEALKFYTQAGVQEQKGKYVDGIELMKKAVAADPNFAEGYYSLATYYRSTLNLPSEREMILKAYSLRDSASEPVRLAIVALYHSAATQDLYEAERSYRNWTELYPRSAAAWNGLSIVERDLGHHRDALIAAQRALELRPTAADVYSNVAYGQSQTGDLKGAMATCELAFARGLDNDYLREDYFAAAYALHDTAVVQKQRDWAEAHPDAVYLWVDEINIAISEGRFADAHRLIPKIDALMRRQGLAGAADDFVRTAAINLMEAGDTEEGKRLFRTVPVDPADEISVLGLARVGEFASAESAIHAMQAQYPHGTLWNDYRGPQVQAILAMAAHKPKDAIAALERARALDGRDPVNVMIRADAYLAAGEPGDAERSYRQVVEGPQQNPGMVEVPLCWLGLGRALAAEGNRPAAIAAYQHFLQLWTHADPDAAVLRQAKQELVKVQRTATGR